MQALRLVGCMGLPANPSLKGKTVKRLVSFIMLVALLISTIVPAVIAGPPPKGYDAVEVDEHTWGGEQRAGPDFWDYTQLTVRTIFNVL